jgi:hypothetical protein
MLGLYFQEMLRCEVPSFADALASLITEADEDETRACLDLLELPPTHVQRSTLADEISTRVCSPCRHTHTVAERMHINPYP